MIVVGTTLTAFAMDDPNCWGAWLNNAEMMQRLGESVGRPVSFFAAIETDARGIAPFAPLTARLSEVGGEWWDFRLDDGRTEVTTANRLRHITMGQNLVTDYAQATWATHLLFMAADCEPPADAIERLIEVDHPLVGGEVGTYCLSGTPITGYPFPIEQHMATAAFVLLRRDLFRFLRWRWDADNGMTDDPCLEHDALLFHGVRTLVRKDVVGRHYPEAIGAVEHRGHDMTVHRG